MGLEAAFPRGSCTPLHLFPRSPERWPGSPQLHRFWSTAESQPDQRRSEGQNSGDEENIKNPSRPHTSEPFSMSLLHSASLTSGKKIRKKIKNHSVFSFQINEETRKTYHQGLWLIYSSYRNVEEVLKENSETFKLKGVIRHSGGYFTVLVLHTFFVTYLPLCFQMQYYSD